MSLFTKRDKKHEQNEENIKILSRRDPDLMHLRKNIRILAVDDEEYDVFTILKDRGYRIFYINDISYVEETEPFDIIVLDIKGVAKKFASTSQGFGFAAEVKRMYPNKIVLCYSGTADAKIFEQADKIDGFIEKDADSDKWSARLDNYIKKYTDINYQWQVIYNKLTEFNLDSHDIDKIKEIYIESYNSNNFDNLKNNIMKYVKDAKVCIDIIASIIKLITLCI